MSIESVFDDIFRASANDLNGGYIPDLGAYRPFPNGRYGFGRDDHPAAHAALYFLGIDKLNDAEPSTGVIVKTPGDYYKLYPLMNIDDAGHDQTYKLLRSTLKDLKVRHSYLKGSYGYLRRASAMGKFVFNVPEYARTLEPEELEMAQRITLRIPELLIHVDDTLLENGQAEKQIR